MLELADLSLEGVLGSEYVRGTVGMRGVWGLVGNVSRLGLHACWSRSRSAGLEGRGVKEEAQRV